MHQTLGTKLNESEYLLTTTPKMTPKRTNIEKPQHSNQTTRTTFSTNAYIPIDMCQDINKKYCKS